MNRLAVKTGNILDLGAASCRGATSAAWEHCLELWPGPLRRSSSYLDADPKRQTDHETPQLDCIVAVYLRAQGQQCPPDFCGQGHGETSDGRHQSRAASQQPSQRTAELITLGC